MNRPALSLALLALSQATLAAPVSAQDVTAAEYHTRRDSAMARLPHALLVLRSRESKAAYTDPGFRQEPNFYYYTGLENAIGAILVLDGGTRQSWLFLPPLVRWMSKSMSAGQPVPSDSLAARLRLDHAVEWSAFTPFITRRLAEDSALGLRLTGAGFALPLPPDSVPVANPDRIWRWALEHHWPHARIEPDTFVSPALRAVKSAAEIAILRRVGASSAGAMLAGLRAATPGRTQREVEGAVVAACLRPGSDGPSFWPWVMSGPYAVYPAPWLSDLDYRHLDRVLGAGEVARLDVGCEIDHYQGDVGRTIPVSAHFDSGQRETIDLLARAYKAGVAAIRDGARVEDVMAASFREAARLRDSVTTPLARRAAAIMSDRDSVPYWQLHGVGLEAGEEIPPVLRAGMVLAYEPIFSVDGLGFYLEDMILVTKTGCEVLTPGLPYTAAEIEKAKRGNGKAR